MSVHNDIITTREHAIALAKPEPRLPISIRIAVASDLKFIDGLQKQHSKMVGFIQRKALEKKIEAGHVSIAESKVDKSKSRQVEMAEAPALRPDGSDVDFSTIRPPGVDVSAQPVGYCIFQDRYDKHEDVGIFFQVNVAPGRRRGLVGAALVKAALERAAYGCKLACCWCAQDLEANHFWESLGFVPLAFRTGSRKAGSKNEPRPHIFWQRRIREGDTETPYWFPSQTHNGALREARLVLPIPPGTHWSDAKPMVLPEASPLPPGEGSGVRAFLDSEVAGDRAHPHPGPLPEGEGVKKPRTRRTKNAAARASVVMPGRSFGNGGLRFGASAPPGAGVDQAKQSKPKRQKQKNDPRYVAAARELRDRYLEELSAGTLQLESAGKYDVSRQLSPAPGNGAAPYPGGELKLRPLLAEPGATGKLAA